MASKEIKFSIDLDENFLPEEITWQASEDGGKGNCKATMLTMWDKDEKNTSRVDLWTKDMPLDEMKVFFPVLYGQGLDFLSILVY